MVTYRLSVSLAHRFLEPGEEWESFETIEETLTVRSEHDAEDAYTAAL